MFNTLKKAVIKANIVYDENEVQEITSSMTEEEINNSGKLGCKHWKVLRKLVLKKMDDELKLNENDVVNKYFVWGIGAYGNVNMWSAGSAFYNRIIITNDTFYSQSYDQDFRCIGRHSCEIAKIRSIKQGKAGDFVVLPRDGAIISLEDKTKVLLLGMDKFSKSDIGCIIRDLSSRNDALTQVNIFATDIIE